MVKRPRPSHGKYVVQWTELGQRYEANVRLGTSRKGNTYFTWFPMKSPRQACIVSNEKVLCNDAGKWVDVGKVEKKFNDTIMDLNSWYPMIPKSKTTTPIG